MARSVGFIVIYNRIPELMARIESVSRTAPKAVADKVAVSARALAPVDTGYLRSSIRSVSVERAKSAEVVVDAPYAAYVEYGTYKMAAQPYLTPAFEAHAQELALAFRAALS